MELIFLLVLIALMAWALASGFPVAFALPGSAIMTILLAAATGYLFEGNASAYFAQGGPVEWLSAGVTNFRGVYWEVERDTLIAIPLFVFMGIMLQRSKIAEDLLLTMAQLFGPVPGGLGISVVFVGALLAATTGILGATVVAMGLISLPAMLRNNYSTPLATGTIAASGTLGQIIPPSIVLIILADQLSNAVDQASTARRDLYKQSTGEFSLPSEFGVTSTSAGDMFMGALVPGLVLVGLYMLYILLMALFRPKIAPSVPFEGTFDRKLVGRIIIILVPPLTLIFAVLGSIIAGVATVNQAGAIGAIGATIMAGYRLKEGERGAFIPAIIALVSLVAIFFITQLYDTNIKNIGSDEDLVGVMLAVVAVVFFVFSIAWSGWRTMRIENTLQGVMVETAKTTSLVFIILLGAAMLTAAFRAFGGEELVREFLTNLPGGFWAQFIIVMAVIFLLGFFLDFIEIAVVVVPIVAPILLMDPEANITAVWLGVMIGLNIQTSFLTPPFGFALFYLRGVAPAIVKTIDIYKGVIPFIILQLVALGIVGYYPSLVNYVPTRISLSSETAPPPVNPRLQFCIEEHVFAEYNEKEGVIRSAIANIRKVPLDALPKNLADELSASFDKADAIFSKRDEIEAAHAAVLERVPTYKPLHVEVRAIEGRIRRIEEEIRVDEGNLVRARRNGTGVERLEAAIARLKEEKAELEKEIPADWDARHKGFLALDKAEEKLRREYRRLADDAYAPVGKTLTLLETTDELAAVRPDLEALRAAVNADSPEVIEAKITAVSDALSSANSDSKVRSELSRARREMTKGGDRGKALKDVEDAIKIYNADLSWREKAATATLAELQKYSQVIRDNIGIRQQPRLPDSVVPGVSSCMSHHRDISLSF